MGRGQDSTVEVQKATSLSLAFSFQPGQPFAGLMAPLFARVLSLLSFVFPVLPTHAQGNGDEEKTAKAARPEQGSDEDKATKATRSKKAKKDPKAPKGARTAYMFFAMATRASLVQACLPHPFFLLVAQTHVHKLVFFTFTLCLSLSSALSSALFLSSCSQQPTCVWDRPTLKPQPRR